MLTGSSFSTQLSLITADALHGSLHALSMLPRSPQKEANGQHGKSVGKSFSVLASHSTHSQRNSEIFVPDNSTKLLLVFLRFWFFRVRHTLKNSYLGKNATWNCVRLVCLVHVECVAGAQQSAATNQHW